MKILSFLKAVDPEERRRKARDAYLSEAVSRVDLERREREWFARNPW